MERPHDFAWGRVVWLEGVAFASLALVSLIADNDLNRAEAGLGGGRGGWGLVVGYGVIVGGG